MPTTACAPKIFISTCTHARTHARTHTYTHTHTTQDCHSYCTCNTQDCHPWHAFNYTLYLIGYRPLPLCGVGRYVVVVWPAGVRVFVLLPSFWQCAHHLVVGSARKGRLLLQHVLLGYSYRVLLQNRVLPQHRVCLQRYHRQATTKRSQLNARQVHTNSTVLWSGYQEIV